MNMSVVMSACATVLSATCLLVYAPSDLAAQNSAVARHLYLEPSQIPLLLQNQFRALGHRLQKPGNERITLNGVLSDSFGSQPVEVIMQLGGKVRIDMSSRSLRFDGGNSYNTVGSYDSDLIESLVDDLAENLLSAAALGSGFHLLGQRFTEKDGRLGDIYEAMVPNKTSKTHPHQPKRYCFDSTTGLLSWVQYRSNRKAGAPIVATHFKDWVVLNGQAVPGTVSRTEGGQSVFTFEAHVVDVSAAAPDSLFTN